MNSVTDDVSSSIFFTLPVQIFLILLLFVSLILNIHDLVFFSLCLLLTALISYIWSRISLYRINLDLKTVSRSLFIGESIKITLEVENRKMLPVLVKAGLFMENLVQRGGGVRKTTEEEILYSFDKNTFFFEFTPENRGVYFIYTPEVRGGDLPGFSYRSMSGKGGVEISVYPRIHRIINFKIKMKDYSGTRKGLNAIPEHLLINGIREYENGSNIRDINWQSTAKHSMLMEKVFDSAKKEKILIILDVNNFKDKKESFELSLEAAASAFIKLNHTGTPSGFLTNANIYKDRMRYFPVSGNRSEFVLILETLSGIEYGDGLEMTDLLNKGKYLSNGISCLYFASSLSSSLDEVKMFLNKRGIPSLYILSDDNSVTGSDIIYIDDFIIKEPVLI